MKCSIMLTTLYIGDGSDTVSYYVTDDNGQKMYCDALLAAEACSKYVLANHHIESHSGIGRI